jgi:hypothetical protein
MANRAYFSIWFRELGEPALLDRLEKVLELAPVSASQPGFAALVVRAVGPDESPLCERDLRAAVTGAAQVVELAREWAHADCSYEVEGAWDLWTYDWAGDGWRLGPEKLEIVCQEEEYDSGAWRETGHFWIHTGFEHLFIGHADLLGMAPPRTGTEDPAESEFIERMRRPERLSQYRQKTQENIRKLLGWAEQIDRALPVDHWKLWSEGEENFEARLDSILAGR